MKFFRPRPEPEIQLLRSNEYSVNLRYNPATRRSDGIRYENLARATQIYDELGFVVMRNLLTNIKAREWGRAGGVRSAARVHFGRHWARMLELASDESDLKTTSDVECSRWSLQGRRQSNLTDWQPEDRIVTMVPLLISRPVSVERYYNRAETVLQPGDALMWNTDQDVGPQSLELRRDQYVDKLMMLTAHPPQESVTEQPYK